MKQSKKLLISCAQCPILVKFLEVFQVFDKRYMKTPPLSIRSVQILYLYLKLYLLNDYQLVTEWSASKSYLEIKIL